jgi:hypothetical protein
VNYSCFDTYILYNKTLINWDRGEAEGNNGGLWSTKHTVSRGKISANCFMGSSSGDTVHINKIISIKIKASKKAHRLIYFGEYTVSYAGSNSYLVLILTLIFQMLYFKSISTLMHDISNNLVPTNISNLSVLSKEIHININTCLCHFIIITCNFIFNI